MKILGMVLMLVMAAMLVVAIMTFPAMLLLGAAHSYDQRIPALGFRALFLTSLAARFLLSVTASSSRGED